MADLNDFYTYDRSERDEAFAEAAKHREASRNNGPDATCAACWRGLNASTMFVRGNLEFCNETCASDFDSYMAEPRN